ARDLSGCDHAPWSHAAFPIARASRIVDEYRDGVRGGVPLPGGTVTFLFTDIEGSTKLLRTAGDAYPDVLTGHRTMLRAAVAAHGGAEVDTEGDGCFFAFP